MSKRKYKYFFGEDTRLSEIRYVDLETYRNHLRRKIGRNGRLLKDTTVNWEMACLRHMLNKAAQWDMIESSPFEKGKSLQLKVSNERLRFLTEDEIQRLRKKCPLYLRNIVDCAINTGMRKSEILTLKWSQVKDGFIYLKKTKTMNPRQIPIDAAVKSYQTRRLGSVPE